MAGRSACKAKEMRSPKEFGRQVKLGRVASGGSKLEEGSIIQSLTHCLAQELSGDWRGTEGRPGPAA